MPIPVTTLESVKRPLRERILELLDKNRDQAYSAFEIFGALEGYDQATAALALLMLRQDELARVLKSVEDELASLEGEQRLQSATYQGKSYYAIKAQE